MDKGLKTFTIIWIGQLLSLVGTAMTRFALLIWAYEQTESAITVALFGFSGLLPMVITSAFSGVIVDRFDRRWIMLLTDMGAGVVTTVLLALHLTTGLAIWHIYLLHAFIGFFEAFQSPAYSAASTLLIPKKLLTRMNGMRTTAEMGSRLFAPFLATALLKSAGLSAVMIADIATFLVAVVTLAIVQVPHPLPAADEDAKASFSVQMRTGMRFIFSNGGLLGLSLVVMSMNFTAGLTYSSILPVMILGKTGGSEVALAWVEASLGIGGIIGGVLVSVYGAPRRLIHGVLFFTILSFALGDAQLALGNHVWQWFLGGFSAAIFIPGIIASVHTIWQRKTPPAIQGRVFAADNMLRQAALVIGFALSGVLADNVFEPAMAEGGALVDVFGAWVGTGAGAGVALMFLGTATLGTLVCTGGYLFPALRNVEDDLPDYDAEIMEPEAQPQVA